MGAPIIDKTAISDLERELRREPTSMTLPSDAEFLAEALTELGIEEVVTVVGKLEPEKQRQVTNSLIARRHGLGSQFVMLLCCWWDHLFACGLSVYDCN